MKLDEKYSNIFTLIHEKTPINFFDFVKPNSFDGLYMFKFGNRELTEKAEQIELNTMVEIISGTYVKRWNDYFDSITEGIKELKNYKEIVKETITDDGKIDFNRNSINKISAYNTEDFVDNSSDDNVENSITQNKKIREYEITRLKGVNHFENIISYLNKSNMYDILMADVNRLITIIKF